MDTNKNRKTTTKNAKKVRATKGLRMEPQLAGPPPACSTGRRCQLHVLESRHCNLMQPNLNGSCMRAGLRKYGTRKGKGIAKNKCCITTRRGRHVYQKVTLQHRFNKPRLCLVGGACWQVFMLGHETTIKILCVVSLSQEPGRKGLQEYVQ